MVKLNRKMYISARYQPRSAGIMEGKGVSYSKRLPYYTCSQRTTTTEHPNERLSRFTSLDISDTDLYEWTDSDDELATEPVKFGTSKLTDEHNSQWYIRPPHLINQPKSNFPETNILGVSDSITKYPSRVYGFDGICISDKVSHNFPKNYNAARTFSNPPSFVKFQAETPVDMLELIESGQRKPDLSQLIDPLWIKHEAHDDYLDYKYPCPTAKEEYCLLNEIDICKLRMERLRLEEEMFLEKKRQRELEQIRGPCKKWYELKTPDFCYEAHKNNESLKSAPNWGSLMAYRRKLKQSAAEFQKTGTM